MPLRTLRTLQRVTRSTSTVTSPDARMITVMGINNTRLDVIMITQR